MARKPPRKRAKIKFPGKGWHPVLRARASGIKRPPAITGEAKERFIDRVRESTSKENKPWVGVFGVFGWRNSRLILTGGTERQLLGYERVECTKLSYKCTRWGKNGKPESVTIIRKGPKRHSLTEMHWGPDGNRIRVRVGKSISKPKGEAFNVFLDYGRGGFTANFEVETTIIGPDGKKRKGALREEPQFFHFCPSRKLP